MADRNFDGRLTLHTIDETDIQALRLLGPQIDALWEPAVDDLYRHLRRFESTSRLLSSDEQIARLKTIQVQHYRRMLEAELDEHYAMKRWEVGSVHHRIQLGPLWFLGAYARMVGFLADDLKSIADQGGKQQILSFVKVLFLDIALSIEAYNLSEDQKLLDTPLTRQKQIRSIVQSQATRRNTPQPAPRRARRAQLIDEGELGVRLSFFECYDERIKAIRDLGKHSETMIRHTSEKFYAHFPNHPLTAPIFARVENLDRLNRLQLEHLKNIFDGKFDRPFAASRLMVGATHEKIGLAPHLYLAGVGHQLVSMIDSLIECGGFTADGLRGLVSSFLFDASLVLDAYLEARRETLLRADSYATALLERLPTGVVVLDGDHRIVSANQALLVQFDLKGDILRGLTVSQAFPSLYLDEYVEHAMSSYAPMAPVLCETTSTSDPRLYRVISVRLPRGLGNERRIALLFDDMTDLRRAGEVAGQAETRWFDLISDVHAVVWEADPKTMQLQLVAGHAEDVLGHQPEELLANASLWRESMSQVDGEKWAAAIEDAATRNVIFHHEHPSAVSNGKWLQSTVRVVEPQSNCTVLRGVTVDVTPQITAREATERRLDTEQALVQLGESLLQLHDRTSILQAGFESLRQLLPDDIILVHARGNDGQVKLAFANPPGIVEEDSRYQPDARPFLVDTPKSRDAATDDADADDDRRHLKWELPGSGGRPEVIIQALSAGANTRLPKDGSYAFTLLTHFLQLALHRAKSERANLQNQKMVALGTFAGGVAHDFNNTLASVVLAVDVLRQTCDRNKEKDSVLDELLGRVDKSKQTIKQIIAFSRQTPIERTTLNLSTEVARICHHQKAIYPLANIRTDIQANLRIRFGAAQVEHILVNLLDNAIQASKDPKDEVLIQLHPATYANVHPVSTGVLPAGDYAVLSVSDHGSGIPLEIKSQIFDPFFTTRGVGIGTGLGLAIVDGYVSEAGGGINVSTAATGTRMEVFLPLADADSDKVDPVRNPDSRNRICRSILIIDDEAGLAALVEKALTFRGHQTEAQSEPAKALAMLKDDPDRFDVVIVDYLMPQMNGLTLIEEARQMGVKAKFILLSGMLDAGLKDAAKAIGAVAAAKPLNTRAIETLMSDDT